MTYKTTLAAAFALLALAGCSVAPDTSSRFNFSPAYAPLYAPLPSPE